MCMDDRLKDLYHIPEQVVEQDIYIEELAEQCSVYETRIRRIIEKLSTDDKEIVETYLDLRDELEIHTVKIAMRFAKGHLR